MKVSTSLVNNLFYTYWWSFSRWVQRGLALCVGIMLGLGMLNAVAFFSIRNKENYMQMGMLQAKYTTEQERFDTSQGRTSQLIFTSPNESPSARRSQASSDALHAPTLGTHRASEPCESTSRRPSIPFTHRVSIASS